MSVMNWWYMFVSFVGQCRNLAEVPNALVLALYHGQYSLSSLPFNSSLFHLLEEGIPTVLIPTEWIQMVLLLNQLRMHLTAYFQINKLLFSSRILSECLSCNHFSSESKLFSLSWIDFEAKCFSFSNCSAFTWPANNSNSAPAFLCLLCFFHLFSVLQTWVLSRG